MQRPRILFVGIQNSPHVARWIRGLAGQGWDLHLFGIDGLPPDSKIRDVTWHEPLAGDAPPEPTSMPDSRPAIREWSVRSAIQAGRHAAGVLRRRLGLEPPPPPEEPPAFRTRSFHTGLRPAPGERIPFWGTGSSCEALRGPAVLARLIEELKPDLLHSMEFQHCGYLALATRDLMGAGRFPPWLATNYGSDIVLHGRDPAHAPAIRRLLEAADLYSCECRRDIALAREFGYRGPELPVLPNSGALEAGPPGLPPPSQRRLLMVKGYDHFAGRAHLALDALEYVADRLGRFEIVLFSASPGPAARARALTESGKLNIRVLDRVGHAEMMALYGQARAYLGISASDGISTSVLEAMSMGCFPIQTDTACCDEWFEDGAGGFLLRLGDLEQAASRVSVALTDDALVDRAARINRETVLRRLAPAVIEAAQQGFYAQALAHVRRGAG